MPDIHKVRIKTTSPLTADLYVDDKKIESCRHYKFEHQAGNLAELTLYAYKDTEIEEDAVVIGLILFPLSVIMLGKKPKPQLRNFGY